MPESRQRDRSPFTDWLGAAASVLGFGLLVFALLFVLSVLVLTALVLWERSRSLAGKSVLLDVTLFRIGSFSSGNVTALTVSLGEFGLILSLLTTIPLGRRREQPTLEPEAATVREG